jgi:2-oxoglutarate dehydrogenase complex dehydrogenase (E1) component-like enzyme
MMIDRYRAVGHQFAKLDPLDMHNERKLHGRLDPSILNLSEFGFK